MIDSIQKTKKKKTIDLNIINDYSSLRLEIKQRCQYFHGWLSVATIGFIIQFWLCIQLWQLLFTYTSFKQLSFKILIESYTLYFSLALFSYSIAVFYLLKSMLFLSKEYKLLIQLISIQIEKTLVQIIREEEKNLSITKKTIKIQQKNLRILNRFLYVVTEEHCQWKIITSQVDRPHLSFK